MFLKAFSSKRSLQSFLLQSPSLKAFSFSSKRLPQSALLKASLQSLLFQSLSFKASPSQLLPSKLSPQSVFFKALSSKLLPQSASLKALSFKAFFSSKLFLRCVVFKAVFERSLNIIRRSSHGSSTIGFHTECPPATGHCPLHLPEWSLGRDKL